MASFLLVHGAWHGAWCWREIVGELESRGHRAVAIDLPAHGDDPAPPEAVTFCDYVDAVCGAAESFSGKIILAGHSMTGVISQAAELIPDRIRALVFIAGYLLPDGCSMMQKAAGLNPEFLSHIVWSDDRKSASIDPEGVRLLLYSRCSADAVARAMPRLRPMPVAPLECPLEITPGRYGSIPRIYVECLQDRVIPVSLQRGMVSECGCSRVYSLDADHCPMFSDPDGLLHVLTSVAEQF